MNELALFAGAGGGILGGVLLGWRTVAAVEIEEYPRAVLLQRQADGCLPRFPVWDNVRTFDGRPWRGKVDVITGGFPCQDISAAGKGVGISGERSGLWSEFARIIGEVRPRYAFIENSPMLTIRGLDRVLCDLASMGYDAEWCVLGAHHVGAPHKRDRIWILGHAKGERDLRGEISTGNVIETLSGRSPDMFVSTDSESFNVANTKNTDDATCCDTGRREQVQSRGSSCRADVADTTQRQPRQQAKRKGRQNTSGGSEEKHVADTDSAGMQIQRGIREYRMESRIRKKAFRKRSAGTKKSWWATERGLDRVVNGMANRVDRLKAIGNGQVPAVAACAWIILQDRIRRTK